MEIILLRHTNVAVAASIIYGRTDVPLADTFDTERVAVEARIKRFWPDGPTRIVSSPAMRCRLLAEYLGPVDQFDDRLWEVGFGAWEMRGWGDIDRAELDAWMADFVNIRPPSGDLPGEHLGDLATRVRAALDTVIDGMEDDDRVLVVAHGAVIRAALAVLIELPLARCFDIEIEKGSLTRVGFRGSRSSQPRQRRPHILGVNLT
jgi:alpha-ribazole phosphatase